MTCLKNILIFLLFAAMALPAQDKPAAAQQTKPTAPSAKPASSWHEKNATARIRFLAFAKRLPATFVPVPKELAANAKHVAAYDDRGNRLEAVPFFADGRLVGAAVNAVKLTAPAGTPPNFHPNASLYLLQEPPSKANPPWTGVSVRVRRHPQSLTTRAFTAAEMLRLFANLKQRRSQMPPFHVAAFGAIPESNPRWQTPPETTYGVSIFIWEALWNVEKPQSVRFGGDQTHVAWTVLLDGVPVANWQDTENIEQRKNGGLFGPAIDAKPGLHVLQFLAVQCLNQPIPQLLVKDAQDKEGAGQPPTGLFPVQRPSIIGVEINGQPDASAVTSIHQEQAYYFQQMNQTVVTYRTPKDNSAELFPLNSSRQAPRLPDVTVCATAAYPTIKLNAAKASYTFEGFARWTSGVAANFYAHVGELTPLVRHGDPLKGDIRVQWPESVPAELRGLLAITAQLQKADGTSSPAVNLVSDDSEIFPFSLAMEEDTTAVVFTPNFAEATPFPPLTVKILRAKDTALPITAQGSSLFENDKMDACRVVFVADPLPNEPPEAEPFAYPDSLFILDDFIATANAPQANLLPETLLAEYFQHKPLSQITHGTVRCPPGTDDFIAIPANLSTMISFKPKAALLAIGYKPLKAGLSPLDATEQILFTAQACRANGIQPIFMTLPPMPDIDTETSRLAALYLKELALRTNTPVIDLYAQALLGHLNTGEWYLADTIAITTLNNAGRAWIIQKAAFALDRLFKQSPASR